ncbi:acetate--CoA ligase family protein [Tautonia rosea]|uniref:acetate--CoA ligase family protein n=1 Tax=Tautonia rosea TaxID=2728037 RepID=UPI001473487E|nr:acetate--CoA ligase [Tautonia rosea]
MATSVDTPSAPTGLDVFFRPRTIAIVGAGRSADSMGGRLVRNLLATFPGPVYPINPLAGTIASARAYASIDEVPEPVDLAFVVVPVAAALNVVKDCLRAGVRGIVMITAGFSEVGGEGKTLQGQVASLIRSSGVRLIGPNCVGIAGTDPASPMNGTFADFPMHPGHAGLGSQSGAFGVVLPERLRRAGVGLSAMVAIGNKADVSENDLLAWWRDDPRTEVVLLYLESFQNPRRFLQIAREVSVQKPIVVLKTGRTEVGSRAAGGHTAALASPDALAEGLIRQAGAIRVDDLDDLIDIAALLSSESIPRGRRVAVLTNAGGPAVLCADALGNDGLVLPTLSPDLQGRLRALVRPEARVVNPVDLIGSTDPALFAECLRLLLGSGEVDAMIASFVPLGPGDLPPIVRAIDEVAGSMSDRPPMLAIFPVGDDSPADPIEGRRIVPALSDPGRAARVLARAVRYGEWVRARGSAMVTEAIGLDVAAIRRVLDTARVRGDDSGEWLAPEDVQSVLSACRMPVPRWEVVASAEEAVAAADRIGGPVALKVDSPTVLHKRAAGGIALGLRGAAAIRDAYTRVTASAPDARGVFVQEMVGEGGEVLVGLARDPQFGHAIGVGPGGSAVEALNLVSFRFPPLTDRDAEELTLANPVAAMMPRGTDRSAAMTRLQQILLRVSSLVTIAPEIAEIDLNPVRITSGGSCCVVDARIRVDGPSSG